MVDRAVLRTGVSVLRKQGESWLVAALGVLHDKKILSDREYNAADNIREDGNKVVDGALARVSAWQVIELTVDLLRSLINRGQRFRFCQRRLTRRQLH